MLNNSYMVQYKMVNVMPLEGHFFVYICDLFYVPKEVGGEVMGLRLPKSSCLCR